MHEEQIKRLEATSDELIQSLEKVEQEIGELGSDLEREKQLRHLARLIYAGGSWWSKSGYCIHLTSRVSVNF